MSLARAGAAARVVARGGVQVRADGVLAARELHAGVRLLARLAVAEVVPLGAHALALG